MKYHKQIATLSSKFDNKIWQLLCLQTIDKTIRNKYISLKIINIPPIKLL